MNTLTKSLQSKTDYWINEERKKSQSVINTLVRHIEKSKLREPQIEAIKVYLWLKFVGNNQKLSQIVADGLLYDETLAKEYTNYYTFEGNYVTQFLNQFAQENKLKNLHKLLIEDPKGQKNNWETILRELLHNYEYSNYLFSLPMGAGKTYLIACFIYLDLYFASLYKTNKRFAHNFVVFAPQATKTAILPSLRTIRDFNPEWVLPKAEADRIKQEVQIEVLDALSSQRRDKLQGNNPNLENVNMITQTKDFGLVFITNAEKVVLEKFEDKDKIIMDPKSLLYDEKKALEAKKFNDLREKLSQVPFLTVFLDEIHHVYGTTGNGEKKLRLAVNILNQHKHIVSVIGLSGTPYVKNTVRIVDQEIRLNQIQDVVYNYSLNLGIGRFLKVPEVKKVEVKENLFIKGALSDFFSNYDLVYPNGTKSKIVFYCPSIEKLNKAILPVIQEWYNEHREGKDDEIFRYYTNVGKDNKEYALPKENLAIFNNLDKPYSDKRVVLLVAVGTEGWDCKSLTAVALPRKDTSRNFVLQTTCRCLREVEDAKKEKALIYLGDGNYEILNEQLKDNYHLSIADLKQPINESIKVQIRKPHLGKLTYKQIMTKYKILKRESKSTENILSDFKFQYIKDRYPYEKRVTTGTIGEEGITGETNKEFGQEYELENYSLNDFIYDIAKYSYGKFSESEFTKTYGKELKRIFTNLDKAWLTAHPTLSIKDVVKELVASLMAEVEYKSDLITTDTEIDLLDWQIEQPLMSLVSSSGAIYKFMPRLREQDIRLYQREPKFMEEDFFGEKNNVDPQDISYNFIPYKMDSDFERNALEEMVKMSELRKLEIYFNGYKDNNLQTFWIQTPVGVYTPDFLILKREGKKIDKILIIETKGKSFYDEDFKRKEKFMLDVFTKYNSHFSYRCFVDEGKNDFSTCINELKKLIEMM